MYENKSCCAHGYIVQSVARTHGMTALVQTAGLHMVAALRHYVIAIVYARAVGRWKYVRARMCASVLALVVQRARQVLMQWG